MLEVLFWVFVGAAAPASLLAIRSGRRFQEHVEGELLGEPDPDEPVFSGPVSLILPVRGADHDLAQNLRSLSAQDYPDYELIVVCRDAGDPAVQTARLTLGDGFRLVVAGEPPEHTGEKVHNLLRAIEAARPASEAFAFADSDGQVSPDWLRRLVAPLAEEEVGATTGFRWYFPEDGGFWPLLRSAWDSVIAGMMRDDGKNFAWGGAMALKRKTFDDAEVAKFWRGAVSDDYRLMHAMQKADLGVRFVPGAMAATTGACDARGFLDWTVRQLTITKAYRKPMWVAGFVAHVVYCGALVMSLAMLAAGNPLGLAGLAVTQLPGMAKGAMRGYAGRLMFPDREEWFDRNGWAYFWLTPLATWVWMYAFWGSAWTRRIQWRGYEYELVSESETRLLRAPS